MELAPNAYDFQCNLSCLFTVKTLLCTCVLSESLAYITFDINYREQVRTQILIFFLHKKGFGFLFRTCFALFLSIFNRYAWRLSVVRVRRIRCSKLQVHLMPYTSRSHSSKLLNRCATFRIVCERVIFTAYKLLALKKNPLNAKEYTMQKTQRISKNKTKQS